MQCILVIRASDLVVVEIETLKSAFFKQFFQPCHSPAGAMVWCQGSLKGIIWFFFFFFIFGSCWPWSLGLSQTWKLHIFVSLVNINNNCFKYLKLCLGGVCAGEQNCSPLAFPEFLGISWVRNPENPFQWMNECTLIADKQIYLLLCVPSVQDFCCSSACCLMGQVKLSLSPWRSWDFNVISAARRFHHGTSEEKNTEFFSIFFHFLHQQFIKRSLWFLLSSKLKQWRTWISLNPARAFQVGIQEICWKREGAAREDPAGIPGWSDRNVLAVQGTPPASSGDREFCWRSPVESSDPPLQHCRPHGMTAPVGISPLCQLEFCLSVTPAVSSAAWGWGFVMGSTRVRNSRSSNGNFLPWEPGAWGVDFHLGIVLVEHSHGQNPAQRGSSEPGAFSTGMWEGKSCENHTEEDSWGTGWGGAIPSSSIPRELIPKNLIPKN